MRVDGRIDANKRRIKDLIGQKFNKLTVVEYGESGWNCICDCGSSVMNITSDKLKRGNTKSCGCLQKQKASISMTNFLVKKRESAGLPLGVTLSDARMIDRARLKPFRDEVFARDGYMCVWCSTPSGNLNAHHLLPWASNPDKRFDVLNMVTLCRECHITIHQGNYHGDVDPIMTIILSGYVNEAYCFRKEVS